MLADEHGRQHRAGDERRNERENEAAGGRARQRRARAARLPDRGGDAERHRHRRRRRASTRATHGVSRGGPAAAAVTSAVAPIRTPPQPGTAVKSAARAIVSRMYRRWSAAWSWSDGGGAA